MDAGASMTSASCPMLAGLGDYLGADDVLMK